MSTTDLTSATWRKSSRSNNECVELPDLVAIRDSKDPAGPLLAFTRAGWLAFLGSIRASDFG